MNTKNEKVVKIILARISQKKSKKNVTISEYFNAFLSKDNELSIAIKEKFANEINTYGAGSYNEESMKYCINDLISFSKTAKFPKDGNIDEVVAYIEELNNTKNDKSDKKATKKSVKKSVKKVTETPVENTVANNDGVEISDDDGVISGDEITEDTNDIEEESTGNTIIVLASQKFPIEGKILDEKEAIDYVKKYGISSVNDYDIVQKKDGTDLYYIFTKVTGSGASER